MPDVINFSDAVASAAGKKHLLLGNGFSRACRDNIFAYGKLFDQADFSKLSPFAKQAFQILGSTDFEIVIDAFLSASKLLGLYSQTSQELAETLRTDANRLREVLVAAVAGSHPNRPSDLTTTECEYCKAFLVNFSDIYTLNYDLLLYWVLMNDPTEPAITCDDGFRQPEDGVEAWVSWDSSAHSQNIYYLHGALHIYNAGAEIQKYTWCNTGLALLDQIRAALNAEKYPIFVAEGNSDQKMTRINRSSFLGRAYRSFENIGGSLFAYGMSFGESDRHIMRAIVRSKVENLYVSLYGDPDSDWNKAIVAIVDGLAAERGQIPKKKSLNVTFYDASSAKVWRP
jgi:hypothetical protein